MKLNDIYQSENEILKEGLIRVIGKVLKYVAIVVGVIFVLNIFKRGLDNRKEEKLAAEGLREIYTVVVGARVIIERKNISKFSVVYEEMMDGIQTDSGALDYDVAKKKDGDNEYVVNTLFMFESKNDSRKLNKIIDRINDRYDMNFEIIRKKYTKIKD